MLRSNLLVPAAIVIALTLTACVPESDITAPSPTTPAAKPTVAATASPTATPTPTLTSAPSNGPAAVTCDTIATDALRAAMEAQGWTSWQTENTQTGARPFAILPDEATERQIVCRWGASPDLITEDVRDFAWTPIDSENAVAAQQVLESQGYTRIEAEFDVYYAVRGSGDTIDAEGWGATYFFTRDDIRWARTKADIAFITTPYPKP